MEKESASRKTTHWLANCQIDHIKGMIPEELSNTCLSSLLTETPWVQSEIVIFGNKHPIPRLNAWYGEKSYRYSGQTMEALVLTPLLEKLRTAVQQATGGTYNSVLLNQYRSGQDTVGWHSDNEPEIDPEHPIASLSFGASRRFVLREKLPKSAEQRPQKLDLLLAAGDLLVMHPPTQLKTEHSIPRTKKVQAPRINLTFRRVL